MLKVVILLGMAVALCCAQKENQNKMVTETPALLSPHTSIKVPSILRELPKPFIPGEFPYHYYPYKYHPHYPYHYQHYRNHPNREDGSGVALHPGGATSFVYPQTHGVGKRSADPEADPGHTYSYISNSYHPYHRLGFYRYPYSPLGYRFLRKTAEGDLEASGSRVSKSLSRQPGHGVVYASSPEFYNHPLGSFHGYSYSW
ncbi:hypothetical protein SK128_003085 [Halocaridina rubra]|uniref:Uncharacterized protein n=1 Tax=Halocaridina rubra TaxID=373956 RepID=A0AAN8WYH8_HALRR